MKSKEYYLEIINKIKMCLQNDSEELENIEKKIIDKFKNFKPNIMVFGIYNHGKSTLINALIGKDENEGGAKVEDVPTTDKVKAYNYMGYTIYDTPGINAPIKHQKVTMEHLKECEIIIFVMSTGSAFEEKIVYEKIIEILNLKKKIIIVLNNKTGVSLEEGSKLLQKIHENFIKVTKQKGLYFEESFETVLVNAKSALKAKKENKRLLLEKSNIISLEKMIQDLAAEGETNIFYTVEKWLVDFINQEIENLNKKRTNIAIKESQDAILQAKKEKDLFKYEAYDIIEKEVILIENKVKEMLFANQQKEVVENYIYNAVQDIYNKITKKFTDSRGRLETAIQNKITSLQTIETKESNLDSSKFKEQAVDILKDKKLVEAGCKKLLLKLREFKVPGIKGRWEKTLGKWAGKAAIVITLLVTAYEIYSAVKKQEEYENAQQERILGINNAAREIRNNIEDDLKEAVDKIIKEYFENNMIIALEEGKKQKQDIDTDILKKIDCLRKIEI